MKPHLIVHPGFAKCATTSLQKIFQADDFQILSDHGAIWLGRGFIPHNHTPPVYEMSENPGGSIETIHSLDLDNQAKYFLSAENLVNHPLILKALCDRFNLARMVFTIRHPFFMTISEYCFRGWTHISMENALHAGIRSGNKQVVRKLNQIESLTPANILLCAIENRRLLSAFCEKTFGYTSPATIARGAALSAQNKSIHPCFADALQEKMKISRIGNPSGDERRRMVRVAQNHVQVPDIDEYLPLSLLDLINDEGLMNDLTGGYLALLQRYGAGNDELVEAESLTQNRLDDMRRKRPVPDDLLDAIRKTAAKLINDLEKEFSHADSKAT